MNGDQKTISILIIAIALVISLLLTWGILTAKWHRAEVEAAFEAGYIEEQDLSYGTHWVKP